MTDENKYPTLAKYEKVADEWCAIESFLDGSNIIVAVCRPHGELWPATKRELCLALAKYFDIDLESLEAERRQLLKEVTGA